MGTRRQNGLIVAGVANEHGIRAARIFQANDRMNQSLIEHLDGAAWRAVASIEARTDAPAKRPGSVRTIAAILTHMHNVRCKWVRLTAPHLGVLELLRRTNCTQDEARVELARSAARCAEMLEYVLGGNEGEARTFHPDGWVPPWPAGVEMLSYMIAHEAHHRGQVCLLAHLLGYPIARGVSDGIWNWEKLLRRF